MEYVLLANPGHNRVYLDAAKGAAVAELCRLLPGCRVEEAVLCGQPAFRLMCEQPLNQQELDACIQAFDPEAFREKAATHRKEFGSFDEGHACEALASFMMKYV